MSIGGLEGVGSGGAGFTPEGKPIRKRVPAGKDEAGSGDRSTKLASVRERMRSGYYKSGEVDEAISDKISGAFDKLA